MAVRPLPVPWKAVPHENTGYLDAFVTIDHLSKATKPEVREYVVHNLYKLHDDDVDYFLPQLCTLAVVMDPKDARGLYSFLLEKCAFCMHFALKTYWMLQACAHHSSSKEWQARAASLLADIETSVVNGTVPEKMRSPHNKTKVSKLSTASIPEEAKPLVTAEIRQSRSPANSLQSSSVTSPDDEKTPPDEIDEKTSSGATQAHEIPYHRTFLKKQRRCTYFNAMNDLVQFMDTISSELHNYYPENRLKVLKLNLKMMNTSLPRGVYFPMQKLASEPHWGLVNLLVDRTAIMNSAQHIPFLLWMEVELSPFDCTSNRISEALLSSTETNDATKELYVTLETTDTSSAEVPHLSPVLSPGARRSEEDVSQDMEQLKIKQQEFDDKLHTFAEAAQKHKEDDAPPQAAEEPSEPPPKPQSGGAESTSPKRSRPHTPRNWTGPDPFGEPYEQMRDKIRATSRARDSPRWDLRSVIFKNGDDLRQEVMSMQLVYLFQSIFKEAKLPIYLQPFSVIVTSPSTGMVETIKNSTSIHSLKKSRPDMSIARFYEDYFGPVDSPEYRKAKNNFIESMVGYSLFSYFLQVKDRHNGNLMLTNEGHLVHIDFGFLLTNSPGGNINFESAPFKLTQELIEVMGGDHDSEGWDYFQVLMIRGFLEVRKHRKKVQLLVEIMFRGSPMPCFYGGLDAVTGLRERFVPHMSNEQCVEHVISLIERSNCNWRSIQYDQFQKVTNGIL